MNRYRTIPGMGPSASKATTTTTCQKCLKKGHYSYECKSSVQSRPYTSRPSRSQQLQNPKLKPALAEQKMEESKPDVPVNAGVAVSSRDVESDKKPETLDEVGRDPPSRKRPRSVSSASSSSVATISTNASNPRVEVARVGESKTTGRATRSRSFSDSRSRSPAPSLDKRTGEHQDNHQNRNRSGRPTRTEPHKDNDLSDSEEFSRSSAGRYDSRSSRRDRTQEGSRGRGRGRPDKRRRSRSADVLPNTRRQDGSSPKPARQRSLSPYSRRLALTQAMNAGSSGWFVV